ncbi:MAG: YebG family protein [Desulfobacteraceae bacterium]|nr:YebG family protein [Desulfobacteraceae bacterium]
MAVVTKYVVVRNGVELPEAFTDKKEAEAYDSQLSAAQQIVELINQSNLNIEAKTAEDIAMHLVKNALAVAKILKPIKVVEPKSPKKPKGQAEPSVAPAKAKAA